MVNELNPTVRMDAMSITHLDTQASVSTASFIVVGIFSSKLSLVSAHISVQTQNTQ